MLKHMNCTSLISPCSTPRSTESKPLFVCAFSYSSSDVILLRPNPRKAEYFSLCATGVLRFLLFLLMHFGICFPIYIHSPSFKDSVSTRMQRARLLLLIGTSYMGHDWSADQFIEKHGGEESETLPKFQFQTRKWTSQAYKYIWKHWKWVLYSWLFYLNKEFHFISSLLQFGSWKWNV